jgi:hypothetical protein
VPDAGLAGARGNLCGFREEFCRCLSRRPDALFELTDALQRWAAERTLCHTYGRGKDQHIMIPGWPYSVICALEPGRSSRAAPLDARRLTPGDDAAEVTAAQVREVVTGLIAAGQWQRGGTGDPGVGGEVANGAAREAGELVELASGFAQSIACASRVNV